MKNLKVLSLIHLCRLDPAIVCYVTSNLEELNLSSRGVLDKKYFSHLPNLKKLYLNECFYLTDDILMSLPYMCPRITDLSLSGK